MPEPTLRPRPPRDAATFPGLSPESSAAGALAVGATRIHWTDLVAAASRTPLDPAAGVLVMVPCTAATTD